MIILGIDPGFGITGFGVIELDEKTGASPILKDFGVIRTAPKTPIAPV